MAHVASKTLIDKRHDLLCDRVGCKARMGRAEEIGLGRFAVLGVEIPAPAHRLVALHQKPRLAAHLAIEKLHRQVAPPLGPLAKLGVRGQKTRVRADLDRQRGLFGPAAHRL